MEAPVRCFLPIAGVISLRLSLNYTSCLVQKSELASPRAVFLSMLPV